MDQADAGITAGPERSVHGALKVLGIGDDWPGVCDFSGRSCAEGKAFNELIGRGAEVATPAEVISKCDLEPKPYPRRRSKL